MVKLYSKDTSSTVYDHDSHCDCGVTYVTSFYYYTNIQCVVSEINFLLQAYYDSVVGITEFGFVINISMILTVSLHLAVETLHWVS